MAKFHATALNGITYELNLEAVASNGCYVNNNGWAYLPSGIIIQWGAYTNAGVFRMNLTFPAGVFAALCSIRSNNVGPVNQEGNSRINLVDNSQLYIDGGATSNWTGVYWIVIGY